MFEKVNPMHPDKIADRIAGACVDLAYFENPNAKIAVEVLLGHEETLIIVETDTLLETDDVKYEVERITGEGRPITFSQHHQDKLLAANQSHGLPRCGDNGIFRGSPITIEERSITDLSKKLFDKYPTDGKIVLTENALTICQSCAEKEKLYEDPIVKTYKAMTLAPELKVNPIGDWTGGIWVDSGATNRKLGSDMGFAVTGGGLHGKDLSKADVTLNICCFLLAQQRGEIIEAGCSIGDEQIDFYNDRGEVIASHTYWNCIRIAKDYIDHLGGFEAFAEWGLIR